MAPVMHPMAPANVPEDTSEGSERMQSASRSTAVWAFRFRAVSILARTHGAAAEVLVAARGPRAETL